MNGIHVQHEWSDLVRSLIVVAHQYQGNESSMNLALRHSQELRSLGKSAELTSVQLAVFVLDMKKMLKQLGSEKEPSSCEIASGFANASGGATLSIGIAKYKSTSGRVIKAYFKIGDIFLSDTDAFQQYIHTIEK